MIRLARSSDEAHRLRTAIDAGMSEGIRIAPVESDAGRYSAPFGAWSMEPAARLSVVAFLAASQRVLEQRNAYVHADVSAADIELTSSGGVMLPRWNMRAKRLTFCNGMALTEVSWFHGVSFRPAVGEIVRVRIPNLRETRVVHAEHWLAPAGSDEYRVGATYRWNIDEPGVSEAGVTMLCDNLRTWLKQPFTMMNAEAGIRPTLREQRPVIGRHPRHRQLAVFNGLGSKGVLQAPFFAAQLARHLLFDEPIDPAVDVNRRERIVG